MRSWLNPDIYEKIKFQFPSSLAKWLIDLTDIIPDPARLWFTQYLKSTATLAQIWPYIPSVA